MLPLLLGCAPLVGDYADREDWAHEIRDADTLVSAPADPPVLSVVTWNMKFAGGRLDFWFDGYGDRSVMTHDEAMGNTEAMRDLILELDPDLLLAQEVEVASHRSAYVDMVDVILNTTDMNHAAWVPNWEAEFVADHGVGPIKTGLAVFSKYPIDENVRIALDPITDQAAYIQTFYLDRCIQRVGVDLGDDRVTILNNHPSAYDTDGTKVRQINATLDEAVTISGDLLIGGDFNAVPPGSLRLAEFADDPPELEERGVDVVTYETDGPVMDPWYATWPTAIPLGDYQVDTEEAQAAFHTHSIASDVFWTRKLDYLFATGQWTAGRTLQSPEDTPGGTIDPMALSDHCPISGEWIR